MYLDTTAFVLRTYPLGEADRIVALLTREHGQVRCVAPRAASSRRRFGGALSVLAEVDARVRLREGRDLGRLESCELRRPTPGEGRDLDAFYASSYMAEVLESFTREAEADDRLYRLTRACAAALAGCGDAFAVCRYFEIWVLKIAGLLPDMRQCTACGKELARHGAVYGPEGEVSCPGCSGPGGRELHAEAVRQLHSFLMQPPDVAVNSPVEARELRTLALFAASQFLLITDRPFRTASRITPGSGRNVTPTIGESA